MNIAIVGGGINGLCAAWMLANSGHHITLYERGRLMQETSSASSKLLHGGLRYLENGGFRLVREALRERKFWIDNAPHLARPLKLYLPVYHSSRRPAWQVRTGLVIYDILAGSSCLGRHRKEELSEFIQVHPDVKTSGVSAVYSYYDAQMDDQKLGMWVAGQAASAGVHILEHHPVTGITTDGILSYRQPDKPDTEHFRRYDLIINIAGPWAERLLEDSGIKAQHQLDLVRGTHILFRQPTTYGYVFEVPGERRIFFVLPYHGQTLVGTTEVRQTLDEPIAPSQEEQTYLLNAYNHYFSQQRQPRDIAASFAGLRPLIKTAKAPDRATREYAIDEIEKVITVFGGKWTTARALAQRLVHRVEAKEQNNSGGSKQPYPETDVPMDSDK